MRTAELGAQFILGVLQHGFLGFRQILAAAIHVDSQHRHGKARPLCVSCCVRPIASATPDCFLDGITRRTVISLAQKRQIKVIERAIMPEELAGFDQCFIVGTAAEVTPVGEIGPYKFTVGDLTRTLRSDYLNEVQPKKKAA